MGSVRQRVLLIDDDAELGELLAEYVAAEDFDLKQALTAQQGLRLLAQEGFVLVLLDVMLPDLNGFQVLRTIRESAQIPIVMLTTRSAPADAVEGLNAGADDYVPKPFTPEVLVARMRTVLRRGQPSRFGPGFIAVDDLILDSGARTVMRGGERVECTAAEFDVLHALAANAGRVVTRESLTRIALGRPLAASDRGVDNLVSTLRKKLGTGPMGHERLRSVRNAGYLLARHPTRSPGTSR